VFRRTWTVGAIRGIDIRIDVSWLAIALLITWSFWGRFTVSRDYPAGPALVMAIVGAALFFASILIHELAHALEAQHRGVEVGGITLFLFGGVTESKFDVRRPRDEFALTAVGPFSSFVLAAIFGLVAVTADEAGLSALGDVAGTLGWLNFALGLFNLLPGAPLDGGRILRSLVWWITNDRDRSIRVAANAGRVVGGVILALGLFQLFFVPGGLIGGLWFAFIGWFLMQAARAELVQGEMQAALHRIPVRRLVVDGTHRVPDDAPVQRAVEELYAVPDDHLPVARDGEIVGYVSVEDVRGVDPLTRLQLPVRAIMRPVNGLPSIDLREDAVKIIERIGESSGIIAAVEDGRVVGIITPERVMGAIRRAEVLQESRAGQPSAPSTPPHGTPSS
jgi:Zn-dependent protease/predicted transcriptional regulator